jgi:hypothetical protein
LWGNSGGLNDADAETIAYIVRENKSLENLWLSFNQIGDVGAGALAEGLKVNLSLEVLELTSNQIGDIGAGALAESLKVNASLEELSLSRNQIGVEGLKALAECLRVNTSLCELYLDENLPENPEVVSGVVDCFARNLLGRPHFPSLLGREVSGRRRICAANHSLNRISLRPADFEFDLTERVTDNEATKQIKRSLRKLDEILDDL